MSKLLNARDLLELVRTGEVEGRDESEAVVSSATLGRRVYRGNTPRRPPPRAAQPAQQAQGRGPRNTQLIEPARAPATGAQPRPSAPGASVTRSVEAPSRANPPLVDAQGRRTTVQMPRPGGAQPNAAQPQPRPPPRPDPPAEREPPQREDAPTLEMALPAGWRGATATPAAGGASAGAALKGPPLPPPVRAVPAAQAPSGSPSPSSPPAAPRPPSGRPSAPPLPGRAAPPPVSPGARPAAAPAPAAGSAPAQRTQPSTRPMKPGASGPTQPAQPEIDRAALDSPSRSATPAQPLRKVSMGGWGRTSDHPPASPSAPPGSKVSSPPPRVVDPRAEVEPRAQPKARLALEDEQTPGTEPSPPKSSVASMFSWVAQRSDPRAEWAAAEAEARRQVAPPQAPTPPTPPTPPARPAAARPAPAPAPEPIALSSEETLVLIHYDKAVAIDALAERTGLSEFRLTRVVANLKKRGVLDEPDEPEQPEPPAPQPAARAPWEQANRRRGEPLDAAPPSSQSRAEPRLSAPVAPVPPVPPSRVAPPAPPSQPQPFADAETEIDNHPTLLEIELAPLSESGRRATQEYAFRVGDRGLENAPDTDAHPRSSGPVSEGQTDNEATIIDNGDDPDSSVSRMMAERITAGFDDPDLAMPVDDEAELPMTVDADMPMAGSSSHAHAKFPPLKRDGGIEIMSPAARAPTSSAAPAIEEDAEQGGKEGDAKEAEAGADDEKAEHEVANILAHYETVLSKLSGDERAKLAITANGIDLYALCYDKEPQVIRAVWQNLNLSHEHARFAAFHHRTSLGLDLIAQRGEFMKDPPTQKRMLRNPSVSEALLRRILSPKRLIDIYKVTLDREASERTRSSARSFLRNKFATTDSEDRMELIWKTEARALNALSGLSIDSKTAALICNRQIVSIMIVQNFTRFAATPPSVIAHFLKQPLVKRQLHLRNALLKHPNCPSDAKRAF